MNPVTNPYAPGAGVEPPELAGRAEAIKNIQVGLQRLASGKSIQSPVLVGLRGVGKTVLLVRLKALAEQDNLHVVYVEASEGKTLAEMLVPGIRSTLLALDMVEAAKAQVKRGLGALKGFISGFGLSYSGFEITYKPPEGVADTGDIEADLPDLFVELGKAAKAAGKVVVIIVDELQIFKPKEFSALIMAMHKINQEQLPVGLIGAGLPQVRGLAGASKSYSERLFRFMPVDALSEADAMAALTRPAAAMDVEFEAGAISEILRATERYPYFLQQWAHDAWNIAQDDETITWADVLDATDVAHKALDESFFRVRYHRCTPNERNYMRALAELGTGTKRTSDVSDMLGSTNAKTAPARGTLVKKGMIYSPSHCDVCFTVPLFDQFMRRLIPDFIPPSR